MTYTFKDSEKLKEIYEDPVIVVSSKIDTTLLPNLIVPFYLSSFVSEQEWIVMEAVNAETIAHKLKRK